MLEIGQTAPNFTLEASTGENISLADFSGRKVIVYFYPKDNTPGCTTEACDFRDHQAEFDTRGVVILGISKDSIKSHQNFIAKYGLNFTLLSDPDAKVCKEYGAWGVKCGREGIIRSTFVIGEDGTVLKVYPKVKVKGHIEAVLAELNS